MGLVAWFLEIEIKMESQMKKKVGIITIIDSINYGNRLQNYAMERLLYNLGLEAYTIPQIYFEDRDCLFDYISLSIKKYLYNLKGLVRIVHRIKGKKSEKSDTKENTGITIRKKKFTTFNESYLHLDNYVIYSRTIGSELKNRYDYFVTGSDQVWNPLFKWSKYIMYLRFAPKHKRIAISASFGIPEIPREHQRIVARYLKDMNYISVREASGSRIVEKYTGKKCDILMDPTLLVTRYTWNELTKNTSINTPENYIAVYFLGSVSSKKEECIKEIAQNNKNEVVWLNSEKSPEYYSISPADFVSVLKRAQLIITDSFHGCAFSIIFKKQFVVFRREGYTLDMFDRIKTLLELVGLTSQIKEDCTASYNEISDDMFLQVEKVLQEKRLEAERILKLVMS